MDQPLMYTELAPWWPLLSRPEDYAEEAAVFRAVLEGAGLAQGGTVLELGSGGGNTASHLKAGFAMTLADRSEAMLAVSRALNPECEHLQGDMRGLRLGRSFDAVFVHDAIQYMSNEQDLRSAMLTAYLHCRPGGLAVFVPDETEERFAPSTDHGGHDGEDGRAMRYLEWTSDPLPGDGSCVVDYVFVLREGNGPPKVLSERHEQGLFPQSTWLRLLTETGFEAEVVPYRLSDMAQDLVLFLARKP